MIIQKLFLVRTDHATKFHFLNGSFKNYFLLEVGIDKSEQIYNSGWVNCQHGQLQKHIGCMYIPLWKTLRN